MRKTVTVGYLLVLQNVSVIMHRLADYQAAYSSSDTPSYVVSLPGDWGKCQKGDIRTQFVEGRLDGGADGKIELQVNGVPVTDVGCMVECCKCLFLLELVTSPTY